MTPSVFRRGVRRSPRSGWAVVTRYVYSGTNLAAERTVSGNGDDARRMEERRYVWLGLRPVAMTRRVCSISTPDVTWEDCGGDIEYFDIVSDRIGRPVMLLDVAHQTKWLAKYDPYGKITEERCRRAGFAGGVWGPCDDGSLKIELRAPGQYHDRETGLYYNGQRYFVPELYRFNAPEPIGQAGSLDLYMYAGGNPVNKADPTGVAYISITGGTKESDRSNPAILKMRRALYSDIKDCMKAALKGLSNAAELLGYKMSDLLPYTSSVSPLPIETNININPHRQSLIYNSFSPKSAANMIMYTTQTIDAKLPILGGVQVANYGDVGNNNGVTDHFLIIYAYETNDNTGKVEKLYAVDNFSSENENNERLSKIVEFEINEYNIAIVPEIKPTKKNNYIGQLQLILVETRGWRGRCAPNNFGANGETKCR